MIYLTSPEWMLPLWITLGVGLIEYTFQYNI